jgi:hypothetical protein
MGLSLRLRADSVALPAALAAACLLAASVVGGAFVGCGGSSSESPWPIDPLEMDRGPKGEALPGPQAADLGRGGPSPRAGAGGSDGATEGELEPPAPAGGAGAARQAGSR